MPDLSKPRTIEACFDVLAIMTAYDRELTMERWCLSPNDRRAMKACLSTYDEEHAKEIREKAKRDAMAERDILLAIMDELKSLRDDVGALTGVARSVQSKLDWKWGY
jgi:hypothetical protein